MNMLKLINIDETEVKRSEQSSYLLGRLNEVAKSEVILIAT